MQVFRAASEDVEGIYRELLKTYEPGDIGILGCSAGGVITSQAVVWLQTKGLARPGAVGIFSAAPVPPSFRGDSSVWDGVGILQPPSRIPATRETSPSAGQTSASASVMDYFKTAKMDDFRAVPTASDEALAKVPPTLWITGTRSFDMSRAIVCHTRFLKLGVDSYLYVMERWPVRCLQQRWSYDA